MLKIEELPDLIKTRDIAQVLGKDKVTVRRLCANGGLPAVKIGREWYVLKKKLLEMMQNA